jgi:hypothetical protein
MAWNCTKSGVNYVVVDIGALRGLKSLARAKS